MKIVECVPNFSEGRRLDIIDSIRKAAQNVPEISVLDCENDPNHNRMVLTFVGPPDAVKEAALESSSVAIKLIDLRSHKGEHPRMGAVDVVPFVPIREVTMDDCVRLANEFALEFSRRFAIPVFLYESAAKHPERRDLAKVREGQFEGLRDLIGNDPMKIPDYGPERIHPSAGATAVGARQILIAYNVNLNTKDLSVAKKIAHLVRGRDGGLPTVKALGFELLDKAMVQVSMNLTDYKVSSISKAFDTVSKHAKEIGVEVAESEIVGLVPLDALNEASVQYLKLTNFVSNQIIENRFFSLTKEIIEKDAKDSSNYSTMTLEEFTESVASKNPTPGGGTVSAFSGSLAASLLAMVCRLTIGKKGYETFTDNVEKALSLAEEGRIKLLDLGNKDSLAFSRVSRALSLPKSSESEKQERTKELGAALREATEVPLEVFLECMKIYRAGTDMLVFGNKSAKSDAETACEIAQAAAKGALSNVRINLQSLSVIDPDFVSQKNAILGKITSEFKV